MNKIYYKNHMFEWEKINMYEVCCTRCMGGGGVGVSEPRGIAVEMLRRKIAI